MQKQHYDIWVDRSKVETFSPDVQRFLQHGIENEKHAVATLCSVIMPAFFPKCFKFFEIGCIFENGRVTDDLLEVSPDGIAECANSCRNECRNVFGNAIHPFVLEIKCPMGENLRVKPLHYSVPKYYACQLLSQMKACKTRFSWFVSYNKKSTVVLHVNFHLDTWKKIWHIIEDLYGEDCPERPTTFHEYRNTEICK